MIHVYNQFYSNCIHKKRNHYNNQINHENQRHHFIGRGSDIFFLKKTIMTEIQHPIVGENRPKP